MFGNFVLRHRSGDTIQGMAKSWVFSKSFFPWELKLGVIGCYHLFWRIPLLRKIAWISSILLFLEKIMIVWAVNGMEPKWEPCLWDKDSREESSYDAVRSVQPERSRELQWRLHLDKKRRITNTGLFWESEVVPVETFLTRSMKVFETMKPAMKAKQIIIEFAIDRTWEHHHYPLQRVVSFTFIQSDSSLHFRFSVLRRASIQTSDMVLSRHWVKGVTASTSCLFPTKRCNVNSGPH